MSTLLDRLKIDLQAAEARLADTRSEVSDLQLAIAALQSGNAHLGRERPTERGVTRGHVQRAVLDCLRINIDHVPKISRELSKRGVDTTAQNISNTLQRLKRRGLADKRSGSDRWFIVDTDTDNEKGPSNLTERPVANGAAVPAA